MQISKTTLCAALIIAVGAALRLYALGGIPPGIHQDEASALYDAWALLHYGIDRNGHSWPVHFVAWGNGLNALYPYMAMPLIWFAGLDIAAYRLPMAIAGIASLWLMWRVAHNAAGPRFALLALLLLALSSWHITFSRWAFEGTMLPFCVLLSAYFLSRHDRHRFTIQAAAVAALALSAYAYGTAYAFAPLFLAAAFGWLALNGAMTLRRLFALSAITAAVTAPMMAFLAVNLLDLDTIRVLGVTIPRYTGPGQFERKSALLLLSGSGGGFGFFRNLTQMGSLLLGSSDGHIHYGMPGWRAAAASIIIAAMGLGVVLHRARARGDFGVHLLMVIWFAAALAASAAAFANISRMNLIWLPAIYLTALGLSAARPPRAAVIAATAAFIALSGLFVHQYFREYERLAASAFSSGLNAAISRALDAAGEDELIYISQAVNQPYIHALYAAAAPPQRYLETRVAGAPNRRHQRILTFDRFVFLSPLHADNPRHSPYSARDYALYWRHLQAAGVDADGIDHYIFKLPEEAADADALDPDEFAVERYGLFAYAYPKDEKPGGGAIRPGAPLVQGEPAARAKFDLRVQDGELIYFKQPCSPYDARERFFLRVVPSDINDLPDEPRRRGYDELDFGFGQRGALHGRRCLASVPLPDYRIAAIETGQTKQAREWPRFWRQSWNRLWTAELKF